MNKPLHVDPALFDECVLDSLSAHLRGDAKTAETLAMMAGVDSALLGIDLNPFNEPGLMKLHAQYQWGRRVAVRAVSKGVQGLLL